MRIKITVSYDGTEYCGWQVQPNGVTVQQMLEDAVKKVTGESVRVTGSGRTDAGVHALGQVAHFDTNSSVPPEKFYKALNAHLPNDIKVLKSERADDNFHACNAAKRKTYAYSLYVSDTVLPLKERYSVMIDRAPDIARMRSAANCFLGEHDFKAFCASGSGAKTTVRTIYNIDIEERGCDLKVSVTGNGFLYNMVRRLVGTLLMAGYGEITERDISETLLGDASSAIGKTLSAKGLCLINVAYS